MNPTRRSLIGSYRYSVMIKPNENEFHEAMTGSIDLYDGKHVIQTHRFSTFDQLATIIMNFWEKSLGVEVNVHRFSNWLSEYFHDIGIENVNFYQLIETVRNLGKGVALVSSGQRIKEAKVRTEDISIISEEERGVKPVIEQKISVESAEEIKGPQQDYLEKLTPPPKKIEEKEEKEIPPTDKLLKPSQVLKKKETSFKVEEEYIPTFKTIAGDPVVTSPEPSIVKEEAPSDTLLRPSEYLKKRETINIISGELHKSEIQFEEESVDKSIETKVTQQPKVIEKKLVPPSKGLVKPSDFLRTQEKREIRYSEHLVKPSEYIKEKEEQELQQAAKVRKADLSTIPEPIKKAVPVDDEKKEVVEEKPKTKTLPFEIEVIDESEEDKEVEPKESIEKQDEKVLQKPSVEKTDFKITDIMGVGEKTAMLLKEGGFETIDQLVTTTPEELSKIRGIGITTAKKLIYGAKALKKKAAQ
ncbi:MAG: helix-hairpin-helix domain-containing protein [Candidatus Heimdallarchaeaceae archaeon]